MIHGFSSQFHTHFHNFKQHLCMIMAQIFMFKFKLVYFLLKQKNLFDTYE